MEMESSRIRKKRTGMCQHEAGIHIAQGDSKASKEGFSQPSTKGHTRAGCSAESLAERSVQRLAADLRRRSNAGRSPAFRRRQVEPLVGRALRGTVRPA